MSRSPRTLLAGPFLGCLIAGLMSPDASADLPSVVTIQHDGRDLSQIPIIIPTGTRLGSGDHLLTSSDQKPLVATVYQDRGSEYLAFVLPRSAGRDDTKYTVEGSTLPGKVGSGFEMIPQGKRVEVRINGQPVTTYIPDDGPKPYLFPLVGPSGAAMTRAFPMAKVEGETTDHPHHRSVWFTHGSVNQVDFWSEARGHGRIVETSRPTMVGGAAIALLRTTDDWVGPDGKKICSDERLITFTASTQRIIMDVEVTLRATEGPVTFGDTKEGMFGLRLATSMDVTSKKGGKIRNAEGTEDKAAWGLASPWVDYSGPVNGKLVGVTILNHPASFRYPTTWHVRDYGLFAANSFGWHDFGQKTSGEYVLPPGELITFRYRVILRDGAATPDELKSAFEAYARPPQVSIN